MTVRQYSYENGVVRVSFDGSKCAHAGYCFRELPGVFDGDRNPPINLAGGSLAEIVRVVERCPSSALVYERLDGGADEVPDEQATVTLIPNGPLAVRGELALDSATYTRLTLCRCGQSARKPFCDGSHKTHRFDDLKTAAAETIGADLPGGPVSFSPAPDGPVLFSGSLTVKLRNGDVLCAREKGALCRCGESKNKPFCDGTHRSIGFSAP
ncbi:MAG: CDGSH iron-sulfur domain-containing protein [Thiothrix sp.]|nr:CDGSH iron-sulfur domain-containing protein [Thiothrix sp.]HPQ93950.1 CDGSH iron-sulfur domain-containing protein [Thiolinea sp.]